MPLVVHLRDTNPELIKAWQAFFGRNAKVDITEGSVFDLDVSVLVIPANSFGIMDDGLGSQVNKLTDGKLESRVRKLIQDKHAGELPVGCAEMITTNLDKPKLAIIAPTMRVPIRMTNANVNSYMATRAAFRTLAAFIRQDREDHGGESKIESVALVGMGTGTGKTAPAVAAFQMYEAYCQIVLGQEPNFATVEAATAHDAELRKSRYI
jgi:O-acetyl-ADP-ribose deacetylase (regulator of RNase III)